MILLITLAVLCKLVNVVYKSLLTLADWKNGNATHGFKWKDQSEHQHCHVGLIVWQSANADLAF